MAKGKILKTVVNISGEVSASVKQSTDALNKHLGGIEKKAKDVTKALAVVGGAVLAGVGAAVGGLAKLGTEYDKATNQMAASTGLVGDELANMEKQLKDVYGNNFGEDMQDVADAMAEVYKQTKLTGDQLQYATEGAFALRDVFGYDVTETARASKAMMTNFGVSAEEAYGLIAAGAQNGLDFSGELIDSINEYSVQFAKLGFSADDMFTIFQKGADSGAWNLDKVGDAIKEFSIRSIDGSKTTTNAFKDLGLNADKMMATFAKGGKGAEDAFQKVVKKLIDVDDQVKRDEIGVALFGTMWEDLGVDAVKALADINGKAYDTEDALSKINDIKYNDLESAWEGIKRKLKVALLPAAEKVSDAFIELAPKIEKAIEDAAPHFEKLAESIGPLIEKAIELGEKGIGFLAEKVQDIGPIIDDFVKNKIQWLKDNIDWLIPVVGALVGVFVALKVVSAIGSAITAVGTIISFFSSTAGLVVLAILAVIYAGIWLWQNWDFIKEKAIQLGEWLAQVWENIKAKVSETWNYIVSTLSKKWEAIKSKAKSIFKQISSTISKTWEDIKKKAVSAWNGIVKTISDKISAIKSKVSEGFKKVVSTISSTWSKITSTVANIWNKVVSTVSSYVSKVRTTISNGLSNVVSSVSEIFGKVKDAISNKWKEIVSAIGSFISTVKTSVSNGFSGLFEIMKAPFDGILSIIASVSSKVSALISKIKNGLGEAADAIGFAAGGFTNGISIAGEDPRYPTEAVISFNPAYRQQNLAYWAKAGQMLGADASDFSIGGVGGGVYYDLGGVTFAPNIVIHGDADRQVVMQAIEDEYPEFLDMLAEFLRRKEDPVYA